MPLGILKKHKQLFRFILCGGMAALVNVGSRCSLNLVVGYGTAIVLAYGLGLLTAFVLFKYIVFQVPHTRCSLKEGGWFILVNALALGQTFLVSVSLAEYLFPWLGFTWHAPTVAHAIGVGVPVLTSYWGHKKLTFGRSVHATYKLG